MSWWRSTLLGFLAVYLLAVGLFLEIHVEHLVGCAVFAALACAGPRGRFWSLLCFPFLLTAVIYDFSRLLSDLRGSVHVGDLYRTEQLWFGVSGPRGVETLPELLQEHTAAALDLICGLAYVVYLFVPVIVVLLLGRRETARAGRVAVGFLLCNAIGIAIYLLYPAAPPWYVADYGLGPAVLEAAPSSAGLARFDELTGLGLFETWYSRSANVFGAVPSLHVAYPTAAFLACLGRGARWAIPTGSFALLVAFSAVYLNHHYVIDVLAGVAVALAADAAAYGAFRLVRRRRPGLARQAELRGEPNASPE